MPHDQDVPADAESEIGGAAAPEVPPGGTAPGGGGVPWLLVGAAAVLIALLVVLAVLVIRHQAGVRTPQFSNSASSGAGGSPEPTPLDAPSLAAGKVADGAGHFTITFPGAVQKQTQKVPTQAGDVVATLYGYQAAAGHDFVLNWSSYPASVDLSDSHAHLIGAAQGALGAIGGKSLGDEQYLTNNGAPALLFSAKVNGAYLRVMIVIHGQTIYLLEVNGPTNPPDGFDAFVGSFRITS